MSGMNETTENTGRDKLQGETKYLSDSEFQKLVKIGPLVSIDFLVKNPKEEYLLGKRKFEPAKDFWFVPGGRIRKGEGISDAFQRIGKTELGISLNLSDANFIGVFEHFYDTSSFSEKTETHYIVLAYSIDIGIAIDSLPMDQHAEFSWFTKVNFEMGANIHQYSKDYVL